MPQLIQFGRLSSISLRFLFCSVLFCLFVVLVVLCVLLFYFLNGFPVNDI
jgi:hypothetical protein